MISEERLENIFLELQEQGAHNINLVTAAHYIPEVCLALEHAKAHGLMIPVVWNSSGYELAESLQMLDGLVDIYLPDLKYLDPKLAKRYSHAEDYPSVAKKALEEMVRQQPEPAFDADGIMEKGVIVRHLLLPGHVREAKEVISYLYGTYGNRIYISLMNQYTPIGTMTEESSSRKKSASGGGEKSDVSDDARIDPLLCRKVTKREYERLLWYAAELGITQGFYQEGGTAAESFVPAFDGTGV